MMSRWQDSNLRPPARKISKKYHRMGVCLIYIDVPPTIKPYGVGVLVEFEL
jgi:hypothetical protein